MRFLPAYISATVLSIIVVPGLCAQERAQPAPLVCAPSSAAADSGRIRLDWWFGPRVGDSVVVVVDGVERWRGVFRLCVDTPQSPPPPWLPAPDSVESVTVRKGEPVRNADQAEGRRASTLIIKTRRKP